MLTAGGIQLPRRLMSSSIDMSNGYYEKTGNYKDVRGYVIFHDVQLTGQFSMRYFGTKPASGPQGGSW